MHQLLNMITTKFMNILLNNIAISEIFTIIHLQIHFSKCEMVIHSFKKIRRKQFNQALSKNNLFFTNMIKIKYECFNVNWI